MWHGIKFWNGKKLYGNLLLLEILKIKTLNRDCKNQPNKAVDTVQLDQLNVSSIWHTVQLAFNHLSYKSLFWLHVATATVIWMNLAESK